MKKLITIILIIAAGQAMAQDIDTPVFTKITPLTDWSIRLHPFENQKVISTYDTTLLFKGIDTVIHNHNYLSESNRPFSFSTCAVLHDAAGCHDTWLNVDIICEICLRNCNVKESRSVEKVSDPYQLAKDRLNKIKQK